ncbi:MAG: hypothetical protein E7557_03985 [Ruminococcaceae bacterium]|nr:hypothetical protein [Oscillospiraceae bacterium]
MLLEVVHLDDFNRIKCLDIFEDELNKLFSKSIPEKKKYLKFLFAELHKIDNRRETIQREEPINYKDITLYSIRKRSQKNTRVLYFYMKDDNIILLTAFDEKNKSDYDNANERAYRRLKNLELI